VEGTHAKSWKEQGASDRAGGPERVRQDQPDGGLALGGGVPSRAGSVDAGTSVGDASPEARARGQSVEIDLACYEFMGDRYCLIDCPGSIEFAADAGLPLPAVDLALVGHRLRPNKAALLQRC
jgi:elongation factor G